jgi:fucose 4-O-acetylase-like acetyltransferase
MPRAPPGSVEGNKRHGMSRKEKWKLGKTRNQIIDAARGCAMLLVVYSHALEVFFNGRIDGGMSHAAFETWRMIFAFHMPAFYFVSGLVAVNLNGKPLGKMLAAAMTLILFADITHLLAAPLQAAALYHHGNSLGAIAKQIVKPLILGENFNLVVTWFLVSLAFVQILAWSYLHARRAVRWCIWAFLAALYLVFQRWGYQVFQFSTWGAGLFFFLLGYTVARKGIWVADNAEPLTAPSKTGAFGRSRSLYYFVTGCLAVAAIFILYPLNTGCFASLAEVCHPYKGTHVFAVLLVDGNLGFLPLFFLTALLGIAAVLAFVGTMQGTFLIKPTAWVGRNTLPLLILNGVVLAFVEHRLAMGLAFPNGAMAPMAWAAVLTAAQLVILPLAKPALDWLHAQCRLYAEAILEKGFAFLPKLRSE